MDSLFTITPISPLKFLNKILEKYLNKSQFLVELRTSNRMVSSAINDKFYEW